MPVIVLEARDFTSPLFLVRTWEVISSCTAFSLLASLKQGTVPTDSDRIFWNFCMFTWCFFFSLSLLIHILSIIQFHSLIPISWKNLTMTVAVLGALMNLSTAVFFSWRVMDHADVSPCSVAVAVTPFLTFLAYSSESFLLCGQAHEQRGYMGSMPGLLKIVQLWGSCQMVPLVVTLVNNPPSGLQDWQRLATGVSCGICVLLSLVTLVVILGDLAGRCLLPFDRFLAGFGLIGVLLYMLATVICFTKILQIIPPLDLVIMETVVSSVTLLAYTVDLAFCVKLLCDRSHM